MFVNMECVFEGCIVSRVGARAAPVPDTMLLLYTDRSQPIVRLPASALTRLCFASNTRSIRVPLTLPNCYFFLGCDFCQIESCPSVSRSLLPRAMAFPSFFDPDPDSDFDVPVPVSPSMHGILLHERVVQTFSYHR
jgi:hypothetical protein